MKRLPLLLLSLAACGGTTSPPGGGSDPPQILPLAPATQHYGHGYEGWITAWVQWLYAIPAASSPALDDTGAHCQAAQGSQVFFLAGSDHSVSRTCSVPGGMALLVPVAPSIAHNLGVALESRTPSEDLPGALTVLRSQKKSPFCDLDRTVYTNLDSFSFQSAPFTFTVPASDPLIVPAGDQTTTADPVYAGGVFLLFAPLAQGSHRLSFGYTPLGKDPIRISYDLTVLP